MRIGQLCRIGAHGHSQRQLPFLFFNPIRVGGRVFLLFGAVAKGDCPPPAGAELPKASC